MKIRVIFSDHEGFSEGIQEAAIRDLQEKVDNLDEHGDLIIEQECYLRHVLMRWVAGDQHLTVEFDTEAGTATVIPVRQ